MRGNELAELAIFLAVARNKSFRKTATERGVAASAISHAVAALEERLGVRLIHRTTRSVALTDAGARFLENLAPAFDQIGKAQEALNDFRETPFGAVRINVPASLASIVLADAIGAVTQANPGLKIEIAASDALVDIVKDGFDAGVRLGERLSQDMVALRIKPKLRFCVVGSPQCFHERPKPTHPRDLSGHACLRYKFPSGQLFNWQFEKDGESLEVEVDGPVTTDSQEVMVELAVKGCGLAYVWTQRTSDHIRSGALVGCLADWCPEMDDLFIYYPSRRQLSSGLRVLIDQLKA
jgi:DNA-binding transcriptional LysR family regulator